MQPRPLLSLVLAAALAGCSVNAPTKPRAGSAAHTTADATLVVTQGLQANLTGTIRFISDHGSELISNNGGSLGSRTRRVLAARAESLLADARVEVLDAEGHVLVDKDGHAITAQSDAKGVYRLAALLPDRDLVLRVELASGGQLFALKPRAGANAAQAIDIDTASSLGSRYVLDTFVNRQQAVLDRLPAANAAALHAAYLAAKDLLPAGHVSYEPADLLATARRLEGQAPAVHTELEAIKAILLAGQANLGNGRLATTVAIAAPRGVAPDGAGGFYVSEFPIGRLRHIDASGHINVYGTKGLPLLSPAGLLRLPDGSLLVADVLANAVRKVQPDGTVVAYAGGSTTPDAASPSVPAAELRLSRPAGLAMDAQGALYVGELQTVTDAARIVKIGADGLGRLLPPPTDHWTKGSAAGIAATADGGLYVLDANDSALHHRRPDGSWELAATGPHFSTLSALTIGPDGALYLSIPEDNVVRRLNGGTLEPFVGSGQEGSSPDGTPGLEARLSQPAGLGFMPDGSLYVTSTGSGLVQAFAPDAQHTMRVVAGSTSPQQVGNGLDISIGSPLGVAIDPQGRVVVAEGTGHTLKRLEGQQLTVIAGTTHGPAAESADALHAAFDGPSALAYDGPVLYVTEVENHLLRKIAADGTVTIVAGCGDKSPGPLAASMPARTISIPRPLGVAVGPDHLVYVADNQVHRVWRIEADGTATCVAGLKSGATGGFGGDGGPAQQAQLSYPAGLAFSPAGDLYVADAGNGVIRKIASPTTAQATISTYAGVSLLKMLPDLLAGTAHGDLDAAADAVSLYGPGALAFDARGNLYVGETGTAQLAALLPVLDDAGTTLPRVGARIHRITPDGRAQLIAGDGTSVLADLAGDDVLGTPSGLAIDPQGRLVIADAGTNQLKLLPLP